MYKIIPEMNLPATNIKVVYLACPERHDSGWDALLMRVYFNK